MGPCTCRCCQKRRESNSLFDELFEPLRDKRDSAALIGLAEEITRLNSEIADLEEDKERLDWLENNTYEGSMIMDRLEDGLLEGTLREEIDKLNVK